MGIEMDGEQAAIDDLVMANRLLASERVLDAFGHVSVRHPDRPDRFLLPCSRAPRDVQSADIMEFTVHDSSPVRNDGRSLYSERFIHGAIYAARPDVHAICHHHSPAVMPFCISGVTLTPVYQHGALMGSRTPFWDSRDEFGDTNLLVTTVEQAQSLARALGDCAMVLMRRHGATIVARDLGDLVFLGVTSCKNAEYQFAAAMLGRVGGLTEGEIGLAANVPKPAINRALDYWRAGLDEA